MKNILLFCLVLLLVCYGCGASGYSVKITMLQERIENADYKTAKAEIIKLIDEYPGRPEPYYLLGLINFGAEKYYECLSNFDEAERRDIEKTHEFYLKRGIALYETGNNVEAEKNLLMSETLMQSGTAQKYLGLILYELGDYSGSIEAFMRTSSINDEPEVLYVYGMALYHEGMNSESLEILMRAYEISPEDDVDENILFQTANLLMLAGGYNPAIVMYSQIPDGSAYAPESMYNSAEAYIKLGDFDSAERLLERYIKLQPDDYESLLNLSSVLIQTGKYVYAADILSNLLEKGYGVKAIYNYGLVNHKLGKYAESVHYLAEAAALNPRNVEYLYAYGLTLTEYGDIEKAKTQMETVMTLDPGNEDAAEWLNQQVME
ncbi:tetratricopeptide repeat protein [Candidatus Latescibacterota bacterium]